MPFEDCSSIAAATLEKICNEPPVLGLETNAVVIPISQIDRGATAFNADKTIITDLVLIANPIVIPVSAFKRFKDGGYDAKENAEGPNGFVHMFTFIAPQNNSQAKKFFNNTASGERFLVVVERKWKGASNADAFEVLGYDVGMTIAVSQKYYGDAGAPVLALKTPGDEQEPRVPYTWLDTNYATTKTAFEALIA